MESIVTDERYKFIQKIVNTTVKKAKDKLTVSDKIDRIVTNRILGIPIFVAIMWLSILCICNNCWYIRNRLDKRCIRSGYSGLLYKYPYQPRCR